MNRKKDAANEKTQKKHTRQLLANFAAVAVGVISIIVCRAIFGARFSENVSDSISVAHDNFMLFYKLSLALCGVLLLLTVLSTVCSRLHNETLHIFHITARTAPSVCLLAILALAIFYAYLSSGSALSITPYLLILGAGEALILRLPCAVYTLFEQLSQSKCKTKGNEQ